MKHISEITIARMMQVGVTICGILVLFGGILCLLQDGNIQYKDALHNIANLTPAVGTAQFYIFCGIWLLVLTQVLRVLATAWLFYKHKARVLALVSAFVFLVLLYTIIRVL
jgi:uncharacterized membrane protein